MIATDNMRVPTKMERWGRRHPTVLVAIACALVAAVFAVCYTENAVERVIERGLAQFGRFMQQYKDSHDRWSP